MNRRALGQHYLVDHSVVERLVSLARISPGERVLEIGTGRGAVTTELLKVSSEVEGFEIDPMNFEATREAAGDARLKLHLGDAFLARPRFDVLVSSMPYSESASFVEWISKVSYRRAVVILQDDFVKKITTKPGQRDYRAITVIAQGSTDIAVLARVPRTSFSPQPRVDSVVVSMKPTRRLTDAEIAGIKQLFSLRRRTLSAAAGVQSRRRVYSLTPDEVLKLLPTASRRHR